jgi:hypothetical protein
MLSSVSQVTFRILFSLFWNSIDNRLTETSCMANRIDFSSCVWKNIFMLTTIVFWRIRTIIAISTFMKVYTFKSILSNRFRNSKKSHFLLSISNTDIPSISSLSIEYFRQKMNYWHLILRSSLRTNIGSIIAAMISPENSYDSIMNNILF